MTCPSVVGNPPKLLTCPRVLGDPSQLITCPCVVGDPSKLMTCPCVLGDPSRLMTCPRVVGDPLQLMTCPCVVGDPPKLLTCPCVAGYPSQWRFQQGVVFIKDVPLPHHACCPHLVLESNHAATTPVKPARKVSSYDGTICVYCCQNQPKVGI